jgi:ankyrin repeat protein
MFIVALALPLLSSVYAEEPTAPKPPVISQQEVVEAALYGKVAVVEKALAQGYKVDARDLQKRTLLMYAAFNGQTNVVQKLILAGADVNAVDKTGSTALMFASSGKNASTVKLLIKKGAKVNTIDTNEHWTALMWAAAEGQIEVVKVLLANKADVFPKDVDGDTAESFAAQKGHPAVVKILQEAAKKKTETPSACITCGVTNKTKCATTKPESACSKCK